LACDPVLEGERSAGLVCPARGGPATSCGKAAIAARSHRATIPQRRMGMASADPEPPSGNREAVFGRPHATRPKGATWCHEFGRHRVAVATGQIHGRRQRALSA